MYLERAKRFIKQSLRIFISNFELFATRKIARMSWLCCSQRSNPSQFPAEYLWRVSLGFILEAETSLRTPDPLVKFI